MIVVSISTDKKVFDPASAVQKRMIEYGKLFEELHIVVFAPKSLGQKDLQISENVWLYPTNSLSKFLYTRDAYVVGRELIKSIKNFGGNVVITSQDPFETGKVGLRLRDAFKCAFQVQVHTDFLNPHFVSLSLLNRVRVGIAKTILPQADAIRVVSRRIKQSMLRAMPTLHENKIDILPIYTNPEPFSKDSYLSDDIRKKYSQFDEIVLMASRLTKEKNISCALEAFKMVVDSHPKAGLVIIGGGPEESEVKKRVNKLGLDGYVVFEPWTANLASAYSNADIFLSSSLYEGYGLTFIESALSGTPIVATDVGIMNDILGEFENGASALVCPVNNKDCLAQKIIKLLDDSELRKTIAQNAKASVEKRIVLDRQEYLNRYKELTEKALIITNK